VDVELSCKEKTKRRQKALKNHVVKVARGVSRVRSCESRLGEETLQIGGIDDMLCASTTAF
jgi:hypothetical protein